MPRPSTNDLLTARNKRRQRLPAATRPALGICRGYPAGITDDHESHGPVTRRLQRRRRRETSLEATSSRSTYQRAAASVSALGAQRPRPPTKGQPRCGARRLALDPALHVDGAKPQQAAPWASRRQLTRRGPAAPYPASTSRSATLRYVSSGTSAITTSVGGRALSPLSTHLNVLLGRTSLPHSLATQLGWFAELSDTLSRQCLLSQTAETSAGQQSGDDFSLLVELSKAAISELLRGDRRTSCTAGSHRRLKPRPAMGLGGGRRPRSAKTSGVGLDNKWRGHSRRPRQ